MDTPSINSDSSVGLVNETSAMDVDSPSEFRNVSSESNDQDKITSNKPETPSSLDSTPDTVTGDRKECVQPTNDGTSAVTDSVSPTCDGAVAVTDVSPVCDGAAAVTDVSPVCDGATYVDDGAAASSHSASGSACDTSAAAEVTDASKSHGANPVFLSQLLEMGVPSNLAIRALLFSGNCSVEAAFTWLAELSAEEADALSLRPVEDDAHDWEDVDEDDENDTFSHKMALVVDTSLRMKPGKTAAQVGHAVLGLYRMLQRAAPRQRASALAKWEYCGEKMVVLRASDGNQLRQLKRKADAVRLPAYLVADAGLTQIAQGSVTVLAVFGTSKEVDLITGDLKLL